MFIRILISYGITIFTCLILAYRAMGRMVRIRRICVRFCALYVLFCIPYLGQMPDAALISYMLQILGIFILLIYDSGATISKCLGVSGAAFLFVYIFIKSFFVTGSHSTFNLMAISEGFDLIELIASLSGDMLLLAVVYLLRRVNISVWFSGLYKGKNRLVTGAISFFIVMWLIVMKMMSVKGAKSETGYEKLSMMTILVFVGGALLLLTILVVYYRNQRKNEIIKMQESMLMQQQMYIATLEKLQMDIKRLRHDYKNIITGLYVTDKEENKTHNFLNQTIQEFEKRLDTSIQETTSLGRIKIEEIKRLVLVKMTEARNKGICFHIEAFQGIEDVFMDIVDFGRCLGILLDNGIEAAYKNDRKEVWLVMIQEHYKFTLIVKNTYPGEIAIKDIWQNGYSTKGEYRGLGLCTYQDIVRRYPNAVKEAKVESNVFTQVLKTSSQRPDISG